MKGKDVTLCEVRTMLFTVFFIGKLTFFCPHSGLDILKLSRTKGGGGLTTLWPKIFEKGIMKFFLNFQFLFRGGEIKIMNENHKECKFDYILFLYHL